MRPRHEWVRSGSAEVGGFELVLWLHALGLSVEVTCLLLNTVLDLGGLRGIELEFESSWLALRVLAEGTSEGVLHLGLVLLSKEGV